MKYLKTHWLQACLDPEAQVSFSLTLFSASSLFAPISDGLSDSGDKMNRKQLFPLANFLGSLLCYSAVHQTTVGIIPFLYSSTEKSKKWTNSQYIIHNDCCCCNIEGSWGNIKIAQDYVYYQSFLLYIPNPIQLRKWQLLLWKPSHNFYLFCHHQIQSVYWWA